jgi:hypothetical protein
LQHANCKSRSATSLSLAHRQRRELHCPALSNCCRFFQLAACGRRTSRLLKKSFCEAVGV